MSSLTNRQPVATITTEALRDEHMFDGVVCFGGEDWWYHNRGHYDIRMMREFARGLPVLYVNSIGMRTPRPTEGGMFVRRVRRKLSSIRRGHVHIDGQFHVLSPFAAPGALGLRLTAPLLGRQVRASMRALGIDRPLVWVNVPTAAEVLQELRPAGVVYQRTDRYECYPDVDRARIERNDAWLKAMADLTVFCARILHSRERGDCRYAALIDHGLDEDRFMRAMDAKTPTDLGSIAHPRIGFVGGIDGHTFDPAFYRAVVERCPEMQFVLIGGCSLPSDWCEAPNLTLLGQKPYDEVHAYMAGCDVLIMPWQRGPWIEACSPVKLKEYLAVGRPIVSTPFPELQPYEKLVRIASTPEGFAGALRSAVTTPGDAHDRQNAVRGQSWSVKAQTVLTTLADRGVRPERSVRLAAPSDPPLIQTVSRPKPTTHITMPRRRVRTLAPATSIRPSCVLLLDGGPRRSPLVRQCGCSTLDLWVTPTYTLLDLWLERLSGICGEAPIRVMHGVHGPSPWPRRNHHGRLSIEREPQTLRGTAGMIADACRHLPRSASVLVLESSRLPMAPLDELLAAHHERTSAVTLAVNASGAPAGAYVIAMRALAGMPPAGYVDLKEQWLSRLVVDGEDVRTHRWSTGSLPALRTRSGLLDGVRLLAGSTGDSTLRCVGSIVEDGATVQDSIIMPEAHVGAGAVVVRSVVTPRSVVKSGVEIADAVLRTDACLSDEDAGATW